MELGFIVLTDSSEVVSGKLYALGAGWNVLRFPTLPIAHQFGIGIGVDIGWDESNERHALELHIEGPDGERLGDAPFTFEFEAGRPPGSIHGQDQRIVLSLNAQVGFETTGPHAVVISVDGGEVGRSRFYVVAQPHQQQQQQPPA